MKKQVYVLGLMLTFSFSLLEDLEGQKQELDALAHFKHIRNHLLPMAQSGTIRKQ